MRRQTEPVGQETQKEKRKPQKPSFLAAFLILLAMILICVQCFRLQAKITAAEAEQKAQEQKLAELQQKNAELEDALERVDDPEYLRELARGELGFVSPGQKDFYDVSN